MFCESCKATLVASQTENAELEMSVCPFAFAAFAEFDCISDSKCPKPPIYTQDPLH